MIYKNFFLNIFFILTLTFQNSKGCTKPFCGIFELLRVPNVVSNNRIENIILCVFQRMNAYGTIDTFSKEIKIITCLVDMFYLNYLI
jgi:hypothetical protein